MLQRKGSLVTLQGHTSFVIQVSPYWNKRKDRTENSNSFGCYFYCVKIVSKATLSLVHNWPNYTSGKVDCRPKHSHAFRRNFVTLIFIQASYLQQHLKAFVLVLYCAFRIVCMDYRTIRFQLQIKNDWINVMGRWYWILRRKFLALIIW
jgi:hypothetical protein